MKPDRPGPNGPNGPNSANGLLHKPFIPPEQFLPEITAKAIVLAILLAAILAGAAAYLGLFAGMTVSASIPAAVISMGVLRGLRHLRIARQVNILENQPFAVSDIQRFDF